MIIKDQILIVLESKKGISVSDEELAKDTGISQAAIWKAVETLREEGYPIEAVTNKGYLLPAESDPISARGIISYLNPSLKKVPLHLYKTVSSTNDVVKDLALENTPHGTTVLAFHQSQGKGRLGRSFLSPADTGIYMSLLLRPTFDMSRSVLVTTAASVAVVRAIEKVCGQEARIKWVNDVYVNDRKVCGILTEAMTDFETGQIQSLILGIGINCTTEGFPDDLLPVAGAVTGDFPKNKLAAEVINQILPLMDHLEDRSFIHDYKSHSMVIGKDIKVFKGGNTSNLNGMQARALDIDDDGGLEVIYTSGQRETLSTGEISIRL